MLGVFKRRKFELKANLEERVVEVTKELLNG